MLAKLAITAPDGTPWSEHLKHFKAKVEGGTQGRVKLKPFLGGALGDELTTAAERHIINLRPRRRGDGGPSK